MSWSYRTFTTLSEKARKTWWRHDVGVKVD